MSGMNKNLRWGILVFLAGLVLPFIPDFSGGFLFADFKVFQFTLVMIFAIAILGLNLLTGFNGQFSLGHGAFYAVGAYTAAILMDRYDVPYFATLPVAAIVCLVFGFLFGLPALRLEGHYLALATFGLALAVPSLLKIHWLQKWTGGVQGIVILKPDPPLGLPISQDQWLYVFTLLVGAVLFLCAWNLLRGRTGRALVAIRDHHMAADTMGINTSLYKSLTFGVSAMYTGMAGALNAIAVGFVSPDAYNILLSITLLVGVVIGGLAAIPGAIFGAIFVVFVPNVASDISKAAPWAIYGVFLIVFMYLMPTGIWGGLRKLHAWYMARKSA